MLDLTEMTVGWLLIGIAILSACAVPYWFATKYSLARFIPLGAIAGICCSFVLVVLVHNMTQYGKPNRYPPLENPSIYFPVLMCLLIIPPIAAIVGWWQNQRSRHSRLK